MTSVLSISTSLFFSNTDSSRKNTLKYLIVLVLLELSYLKTFFPTNIASVFFQFTLAEESLLRRPTLPSTTLISCCLLRIITISSAYAVNLTADMQLGNKTLESYFLSLWHSSSVAVEYNSPAPVPPSEQQKVQPNSHHLWVYLQYHDTVSGSWPLNMAESKSMLCYRYWYSARSNAFSWSMEIRPTSIPSEPEMSKTCYIKVILSHSMHNEWPYPSPLSVWKPKL